MVGGKRIDPASFRSYQPIITVSEAAEIARSSTSTIYSWVSQGRIRRSVKRGRPLLFLRDEFVNELFGRR